MKSLKVNQVKMENNIKPDLREIGCQDVDCTKYL